VLLAFIELPSIQERYLRIENVRMEYFRRCSDFGNPIGITTNSVKIIVRHEVLEVLPPARGWRRNDRRPTMFQPG
jgi:hypothetical protein